MGRVFHLCSPPVLSLLSNDLCIAGSATRTAQICMSYSRLRQEHVHTVAKTYQSLEAAEQPKRLPSYAKLVCLTGGFVASSTASRYWALLAAASPTCLAACFKALAQPPVRTWMRCAHVCLAATSHMQPAHQLAQIRPSACIGPDDLVCASL